MFWDGGGTIQVQPVEVEACNQCISQIWVVGGCVDLSLGLCFGESLLVTDAGEILVFGISPKQPPKPSLCAWERYSSPGCAGSPVRTETSAAASHLYCNVFLSKHHSYCSVDDFFFCCNFKAKQHIFPLQFVPAKRKEERKAIGMNCFVGDVQTNRGAIRRANRFQNSLWGWTGGRCAMGTCNVLYKGTVTFSCVLKSLPEMEADFAEAGEPRASSAPACSWGCYAAEGPRYRTG